MMAKAVTASATIPCVPKDDMAEMVIGQLSTLSFKLFYLLIFYATPPLDALSCTRPAAALVP